MCVKLYHSQQSMRHICISLNSTMIHLNFQLSLLQNNSKLGVCVCQKWHLFYQLWSWAVMLFTTGWYSVCIYFFAFSEPGCSSHSLYISFTTGFSKGSLTKTCNDINTPTPIELYTRKAQMEDDGSFINKCKIQKTRMGVTKQIELYYKIK